MAKEKNALNYSIVIPIKNEEGNIEELFKEVSSVMKKVDKPWELIAIEDGSTDRSLEILRSLKIVYPELKLIVFDKNYGQSAAFDAGFKNARGDFIITLDGDRQNDPHDIPSLISLSSDADLVCGIRKKRKDTLSKRLTSKMANWIRQKMCNDGVKDTGCSLKLYRKDCFRKIKLYKGMHRFLPALFTIEGFRVKEVDVNHRERVQGLTKYTFFNRSFNTVADLFAVRWMKKRHLNYRFLDES